MGRVSVPRYASDPHTYLPVRLFETSCRSIFIYLVQGGGFIFTLWFHQAITDFSRLLNLVLRSCFFAPSTSDRALRSRTSHCSFAIIRPSSSARSSVG